jgi:ATP-dependent Lon protease
MSEDFPKGMIKFQRKFLYFKKETEIINQQVYFYKEILMSMINNLSFCNNLKIFQETESTYISILSEIKEIKELIDEFVDNITIKYVLFSGLKLLKSKLSNIKNLIIKFMNHISSENIQYIFKLLLKDNWIEQFDKSELDKILFISKFIRPICIWDSDEHKKEINLLNTSNDSNKKSSLITKELIETLLGIRKNDSSLIIAGDTNMPNFLKNISDFVESNPKKQLTKRNNHFTKLECMTIIENNTITITKNQRSISLIEDKYGCCIFFCINNTRYLVIQGLFKDDLLNLSSSIKYVKNIIIQHKNSFEHDAPIVPKKFKDSYFNIISLRDLIVCKSFELIEDLRKKFNDFKIIQSKPLLSLINEFLLASKYRKMDILTLLLMSNEDDQKLAYVLFDVFRSKDKKDMASEIYSSLHHTIREMLDISKSKTEKEENDLSKFIESDLPYERRIGLLKTEDDVKAKAMEKLKSMKSAFQGDSKAQHWLDGLLKIPFGIYKENDILSFKENFIKKLKLIDENLKLFSDNDIDQHIDLLPKDNLLIDEWKKYKVDKKNYLVNVRKTLDSAVFGHKEGKIQLERLFAQWINGEAKGAVLGLKGPPGTGKTSLAKNGLSKCLIDSDGNPRPFVFLPIGGSVNGSTLVGHNFTYVGSTWGRIADILMTTNCMNPIIFIDEVDKVSHTEHGREIISILTHLTDSTQNDEFEDKYFAGIKLNLSKALIVLSFNDTNLIDPILRDRITIIETNPLTLPEKLTIINDYMLPDICKEIGFNKNEIIIPNELIKNLIETYTNEAGVRKIKEKIVEIIRDINLNRFHNNDFQLPYLVKDDYIKTLFENQPKIRVKKISKEPVVGIVNGLYASSGGGIGGITMIQAIKFPSEKMLDLHITGQAGDVMKESIQYAMKNAYGLLTLEEQDKILEDSRNKKSFAIHIHCPDGATPKDGPSAGLAFTLAIYSLLSGKKIRNDVCMTGEIDLIGNAGIIGGLNAKLHGGKKAGCTLALIPEDNLEDLDIMRREGNSPEDDTFKVITVSNISDVIKYSICN